jgi:hypothetical protein
MPLLFFNLFGCVVPTRRHFEQSGSHAGFVIYTTKPDSQVVFKGQCFLVEIQYSSTGIELTLHTRVRRLRLGASVLPVSLIPLVISDHQTHGMPKPAPTSLHDPNAMQKSLGAGGVVQPSGLSQIKFGPLRL